MMEEAGRGAEGRPPPPPVRFGGQSEIVLEPVARPSTRPPSHRIVTDFFLTTEGASHRNTPGSCWKKIASRNKLNRQRGYSCCLFAIPCPGPWSAQSSCSRHCWQYLLFSCHNCGSRFLTLLNSPHSLQKLRSFPPLNPSRSRALSFFSLSPSDPLPSLSGERPFGRLQIV